MESLLIRWKCNTSIYHFTVLAVEAILFISYLCSDSSENRSTWAPSSFRLHSHCMVVAGAQTPSDYLHVIAYLAQLESA